MVDAYLYASEGRYSPEITKLRKIERFGLEAITGRRVFLYRDYIRMTAAEHIVNIYNSRDAAQNWAAWTAANQDAAELLNRVEQLCPNP